MHDRKRYVLSFCLAASLTALLIVGQARAQPRGNPFHSQIISQVVDVRGRVIGKSVGPPDFSAGAAKVEMWHAPSRSMYVVYFTRDYIFADAGDVLYDAPDCTGVPLIIWNPYDAANAMYKPAAIGPRHSIWIPKPAAAEHPVWPKSRWIPNHEICETLDWVEPDEPHTPAIPLIEVGALDDYFERPYGIR